MRLLYLNHNVAYTGTFFRAFNVGREMVARGHQVTLVTTRRRGRLAARRQVVDGVEMIQAPDLLWGPGRTGWDPWNTLRRIGLLKDRAFDIVHAFDSRPAVVLPALAVRRRTGAALFMDWADWWGRGGWIEDRSGWFVRTFFGPIETWFEEAFRLEAVGSTVISSALQRRLVGLGVDDASVLKVPNGCDLAIEPGDRAAARRSLGLSDEPVAVHIGIVTPGDLRLLTDAMRRVRARLPRAKLILVGNVRPRVPEDLEAEGAVVRTGFVTFEVLKKWLAAADIGVVPMRDSLGNRGRWPGKINDYFSAGRATVMPRVGDAARLLERESIGWTSEADPRSFADAMIAALSDPDACAAAGERARHVAETTMSWRRIAERFDAHYSAVLCGGRSRSQVDYERTQ